MSNTAQLTVGAGKVPAWLRQLNAYRSNYGSKAVVEDRRLRPGLVNHIRYMGKTGEYSHYENPKSKWYTKSGAQAGLNSVLDLGPGLDSWMATPFHGLDLLDQEATQAEYVYDTYSGLKTGTAGSQIVATYPRTYPGDGHKMPYSTGGSELPDSVSGCPKAWRDYVIFPDFGPPIMFTLGHDPGKVKASLTTGSKHLAVCVITEDTYKNSNATDQFQGRVILASYGHTVVLIPRDALHPGKRYTASVATASGTVTTTFTVS